MYPLQQPAASKDLDVHFKKLVSVVQREGRMCRGGTLFLVLVSVPGNSIRCTNFSG